MDDLLFLGTEGGIDIDAVLRDACVRLNQLGIPAMEDGLIAMQIQADSEPCRAHGIMNKRYYLQVSLKNAPSCIGITRCENEIVPGYSWFQEPYQIAVSVWVGADAIHRALAGIIATAIAANVGGQVLDTDHKWSDKDLNDPEEFMDKVARKYIGS